MLQRSSPNVNHMGRQEAARSIAVAVTLHVLEHRRFINHVSRSASIMRPVLKTHAGTSTYDTNGQRREIDNSTMRSISEGQTDLLLISDQASEHKKGVNYLYRALLATQDNDHL